MSKQETFSAVFNDASVESIEFNSHWSNGTGYFDFAVYGEHAPRVPPGKVVKCMTPGNRRMVVVGTHLGNVVVFDRYAGNERGIFVYNTTSSIERTGYIRNHSLQDDDMVVILGDVCDSANIGERIKAIFEGCQKAEKRFEQRF
jgi:hypothetical protein